jgi:hypothetical protein
VLLGDPSQGEAYLHEFVHAVLGRRIGGGAMLGEGIPVWLGGSRGRTATEMYQLLAQYQSSRPDVTLESLLRGTSDVGPQVDDLVQATGALIRGRRLPARRIPRRARTARSSKRSRECARDHASKSRAARSASARTMVEGLRPRVPLGFGSPDFR